MSGKKKASARRATRARASQEDPTPPGDGSSGGEKSGDTGGEGEKESRPELTKKQKKELFQAYQVAADALEELMAHIDTAKEEMSDAAKAISEQIHNGPFIWKGQKVQVVQRKGRFFMRTLESDAEEI